MTFYRLIQGDCAKVLKTLDDSSIDAIVTDPPYAIGFMNKSWDQALPPRETFQECFRVLKHGGLAFVMSSPRQDVLWRMMALLEGVGFELRQSPIYWTYASGFPKAMDVAKNIDKKLGVQRKVVGTKTLDIGMQGGQMHSNRPVNVIEVPNDVATSELAKKWDGWKSITGLKPAVEVVLMVNKPRIEKTIVDNVLKHGVGAMNVEACRIPLSQNDDWMKAEYPHRTKGYDASSYKIDYPRKSMSNLKGRFPANLLVSDDVLDTGKIHKSGKVEPHHTLSKGDGQGYAFGDIYGKYKQRSAEDITSYGDSGGFSRFFSLDAWWLQRVKKLPKEVQKTFPFLVVPKASKSERDKGLSSFKEQNESIGIRYKPSETILILKNPPDKEDLSEYLKFWRGKTGFSQKNIDDLMGWNTKYSWLEGRKRGIQLTTPENWFKLKNILKFDDKFDKQMSEIISVNRAKPTFKETLPRRNNHPTVKPLKLMSYLIELGCPVGGVVLDPFVGSGTTLVASYLMNKSGVGIELNPEYCAIADEKMRYFTRQSTEQKGLFKTDYSFEVASP